MSPWLAMNECTFVTDGRRCRAKIPAGRSRCSAHQHRGVRRNRPRDLPPDWPKIRAAVLDRDPICKLCGFLESTTADHKVDRADGGSDDMDNLQGVCTGCHSSKTARSTAGFAKKGNR